MTTPATLPNPDSLIFPPPADRVRLSSNVQRPRPLRSITASAQRITRETVSRRGSSPKGWQDDAWEMYDLVGEHRFLAATLAGRMSQARLYVGELSDDPTEDPIPVEDERIASILEAVGGSAAARAQIVNRLGINLFVPGDGWIVGIPRYLFPSTLLPARSLDPELIMEEEIPETTLIDIEDLEWRAMSVSEVSITGSGEVTILLGEGDKERLVTTPEKIFLIRTWRPHPRKAWEADSPTRSSLPVLRELVGLTMHVSAQIDSRLAGAGLLIVPQSAKRALLAAAGLPEDSEEDPFTDALIEAMLTPTSDRSNASALVPLVVVVPDEAANLFQHMTFAKPLDAEARNLRDEAIRRLALGLDAPPELLLGTGGMNHWGAWLVQEDVVTTHLEPPLALICDALTTQYLWPVLLEQGMDEEEARQYVIWYDVSDLMVRPNHSQDALELHSRDVISNEALRRETGFDEEDAPWLDRQKLEPYIRLAFDMVAADPSLANAPGIPKLAAQIKAVLDGDLPDAEPAPVPAALGGPPGEQEVPGGPPPMPQPVPATQGAPAQPETGPPGLAASLTAGQVMAAFLAEPNGREFIEGYLAKAGPS